MQGRPVLPSRDGPGSALPLPPATYRRNLTDVRQPAFGLIGLIVLLAGSCAAAGEPEAGAVDPETAEFSQYVSDVERLNGMYRGVADFCLRLVPAAILAQSDAAWRRNN